jgi:putative heme-binding domain-containing protein
MAVRPDGRLIVCDQYGGMYGINPPALGDEEATTEANPLNVEIGGAHGLLWHRGALYVAVNERGRGGRKNGVYRVTDSTGDGELDHIEVLKEFGGGGEHGLHSMVPSPDGEWIYFIHGNHANPPEMDHYWMPRNWGEDHLLPRNPDGNGHASGTMAPGGAVLRFKPDGSRWEMVGSGFRNPYDLAFNEHGDLFAYDADMEWDLGMPWYRPTRMNHVVPGAEFGWRNGTGKWPVYYEDSLPAVVDIGPGSPTGVLSGLGSKFPAKYQKAIFLLDWTFATIHAIHLEQDGSTYKGTKEEFVAGPGLPLTDAEIGKDGAMYFMTGGRRTASALWRVSYTGSESTVPVKRDSAGSPLPELVEELRTAEYEKVIEKMGSDDRFVRFLARVEAERRPMDELKKALAGTVNPWQRIGAAIALARQGKKEDRATALAWLDALKWDSLGKPARLGLLRAYALVFARLGAPSETEWKAAIAALDSRYPAQDAELDAELCRVLCYLQAPKVVERTLKLMAAPKDTTWPDWAELASRNSGYGRAVLGMLRNTPPAEDIHYAFSLRVVKGPWTEGQRQQIMRWYGAVRSKTGGNSYLKFIARMQDDMLKNATTEERDMIAKWDLTPPRSPFEGLPTPVGPGRSWTVADVVELGEGDLSASNLENGKKMFRATLCAACHRVNGEGGSAGPDLSAVGGRFSVADIAEALLEPNKVVSDQYQFQLISMKDGSTLWGRVMEEKDDTLVIATSAYDYTKTQDVLKSKVTKVEASPVSPMPPGLINSLNATELRDLLGYLLKK